MSADSIKKYWPIAVWILSGGTGVTGAGFAVNFNIDLQQAQVKAHLAQCQQCSEELKRLQGLIDCAGRMGKLSAESQVSTS